jgi:hypothetical protein
MTFYYNGIDITEQKFTILGEWGIGYLETTRLDYGIHHLHHYTWYLVYSYYMFKKNEKVPMFCPCGRRIPDFLKLALMSKEL